VSCGDASRPGAGGARTNTSAPRRVVVNALFLAPGASGGTETYLRGLVPALARNFPAMRLTVVATRSGRERLRADGWTDICELRALPCEESQRGRRQLAEQILLPGLARQLRADLVHSLASVGPIRTPGVSHVITVHDVTFFHEQTFARLTTLGMKHVVTRASRHADRLIAVSAEARDEICRVIGLPPERFAVVHHGAERPAVAPSPDADVRARYSLNGRRVVLCVATKRPHKNQELLVRAVPLLEPDVVVVLAGHPEQYDRRLRALAISLDVADRLRFVDYVPEADLETLWRLAGCAAFPTRAEGFGLPVLEALRHAVPVVASNLPVFREIAGDLPVYFDPDSPEEAAAAIRAALGHPAMGRRGPAWAAQFTWDKAAEGTFGVYERALANRSC
jgi:glycosyltransferase involved in cell wall biosynthesis